MVSYTLVSSSSRVVIPPNVTDLIIAPGCPDVPQAKFQNHPTLKTVTVAPRTQWFTIARYAFRGCAALESINFNDVKIQFDPQCFSGCTALKSVTLSNNPNCVYMGDVFSGCTALTKIHIGAIPTWNPASANTTFRGCDAIRSISIPRLADLSSFFDQTWIDAMSDLNGNIRMGILNMGREFHWGINDVKKALIHSNYTYVNSSVDSVAARLYQMIQAPPHRPMKRVRIKFLNLKF